MSDSKNILFIHGTGGDHTAFDPQVQYFKSSYQVMSIDLRGHGENAGAGSDEVSYEIQDFAQDIKALVKSRNLQRVTLVGHSLGGLIALELASENPEWLDAVVLLDTAALIPAPVAQAMAPLNEAFAGPNYGEVLREFATQYFFRHGDQSQRKSAILRALGAFPQAIFLKIWKSMGTYDAAKAAERCRVPALFIHASVPTDLDLLEKVYPGIRIERLQNSGHFAQLEQPEKVNQVIENFMQSLQ